MRFFKYAISKKDIFTMLQSIIFQIYTYRISYNIILLRYRIKYNM